MESMLHLKLLTFLRKAAADSFKWIAALTVSGLSVVPGSFLLFQNILILFHWFPGSQTRVRVVVCYVSPVLTIRKNLLG